MPQILIILLLFGIGTSIGSFLNVLIYRIQRSDYRGIIFGRSNCPHCRKKIAESDLIPIISYFMLYGRCRHCRKKISLSYLLTELLTGLTFILAFISFPQAFYTINNTIFFILTLYFLTVLIFTTVYDILYLEVSDLMLLPAIGMATLALFHPLSPDFRSALAGAALSFGFFYLQIFISKGRWVGGGDLRIAVFMGLILGFQNTIVALTLAYFIGSIVSIALIGISKLKFKSEIPFAPFLCMGTFIAFYYGNFIANWYLHLLGINNI